MQTFMTYTGTQFHRVAKSLDRMRLGKQRVETLQIVRTLCGITSGWSNHPAVKMWRGHVGALCVYGCAMCDEWIERGYNDNLRPIFAGLVGDNLCNLPTWVIDDRVIYSHRSNLIRKLPEHYAPMWPDVSPGLPYVWPEPEGLQCTSESS